MIVIGNIEQMPVSARLLGIKKAVESDPFTTPDYFDRGTGYNYVFDDSIQIKPNRIEVHDDVIVLLSVGNFECGTAKRRITGEVNIPVGTHVRWEIN
jgi:hypothetical protein